MKIECDLGRRLQESCLCWVSVDMTTGLIEGKSNVRFDPIHLLQLYSYRVLARNIVIDVTGTVRGEICEAILVVGDLVFPKGARQRQIAGTISNIRYPSYKPTEFWTKRRVSSGSSCGRFAGVRSIFVNISSKYEGHSAGYQARRRGRGSNLCTVNYPECTSGDRACVAGHYM